MPTLTPATDDAAVEIARWRRVAEGHARQLQEGAQERIALAQENGGLRRALEQNALDRLKLAEEIASLRAEVERLRQDVKDAMADARHWKTP